MDTHSHEDSALPHLYSWGGEKKSSERFHRIYRWKSQVILFLLLDQMYVWGRPYILV